MARQEYLRKLAQDYHQARGKRQKGMILDEYCKNTGQNRKYVIGRMQPGANLELHKRKKRKKVYGVRIQNLVVQIWEIFDYPCGQRLVSILRQEVKGLVAWKEMVATPAEIKELQRISSSTLDRLLAPERAVVKGRFRQGQGKRSNLLYQRIPMRLNDWDTQEIGNEQIDYVEHCGSSNAGQYLNTLSVTDIGCGWWDGEAVMGRGQFPTLEALQQVRARVPFTWKEIHPDNEHCFINEHVERYCQQQGLAFSRSRPNRKNDNCYVEQKNWTHVKKVVGYLRYDSLEELVQMNRLYADVGLFKNFFCPVMKLKEKHRIGGKVHRKYDSPKTPYQRLMESDQFPQKGKKKLKKLHSSLNPAELKRRIESQLEVLFDLYQKKQTAYQILPQKQQKVRIDVTKKSSSSLRLVSLVGR